MVINSRKENGIMVFDIFEYEEEHDLALICDILTRKYKVEIKDKLEGPGATIWDLEIDRHHFSLINNSYGNFFKPRDIMSELFMEQEIPVIKSL